MNEQFRKIENQKIMSATIGDIRKERAITVGAIAAKSALSYLGGRAITSVVSNTIINKVATTIGIDPSTLSLPRSSGTDLRGKPYHYVGGKSVSEIDYNKMDFVDKVTESLRKKGLKASVATGLASIPTNDVDRIKSRQRIHSDDRKTIKTKAAAYEERMRSKMAEERQSKIDEHRQEIADDVYEYINKEETR